MDGFHTFGGVTSYPGALLLRAAWWTPLIFALVYVLIAMVFAALVRNEAAPSRGAIFGALIIFGALYAMTGFAPLSTWFKAILLLLAWVALWFLSRWSRAALAVGLIGALLGPLAEIALVQLGLLRHHPADFLGIPLWLPALYLCCGAGLGPFLYYSVANHE